MANYSIIFETSKLIVIIIIFNIYIAQNNIQEDMIKCILHIKIKSKITMLPIYNFEFTIKCEDVYYETLKRNYKLNASLK